MSTISEATDSSPTIRSSFNLPDLSEELHVEILWRLPLKSLTQMTIVCKSWQNLIRSSEFLSLRRKNWYSSPNYSSSSSSDLLLMHSDDDFDSETVFLGSLDDDDAAADAASNPIHFVQEFPSSLLPSTVSIHLRVVGLCNGMICINDLQHGDLFIWNPITQFSRIIQNPLLHHQEDQIGPHICCRLIRETAGFGFDPKLKDYKILHMVELRGRSDVLSFPQCDYWLYSLSSNSWKKLEFDSDFFPEFWPYLQFANSCSLPFTDNRIICWLASSVEHRPLFKNRRVMLFDTSAEAFDFIPVEVEWGENIVGRPFAFMETIALLASHSASSQQCPNIIVDPGFDILLLDDFFSTRSSWCKFFSISSSSPGMTLLTPLGVGKYEQLIFQGAKGELILFNPYNCLVTKTGVIKPRMFSVFVFKQSSGSASVNK